MGCLIFAVGGKLRMGATILKMLYSLRSAQNDGFCGICQLLRSRFPRKCTTIQVQ